MRPFIDQMYARPSTARHLQSAKMEKTADFFNFPVEPLQDDQLDTLLKSTDHVYVCKSLCNMTCTAKLVQDLLLHSDRMQNILSTLSTHLLDCDYTKFFLFNMCKGIESVFSDSHLDASIEILYILVKIRKAKPGKIVDDSIKILRSLDSSLDSLYLSLSQEE